MGVASSGGASLHARWSEEVRAHGAEPPATELHDHGHVYGSIPRKVPEQSGPQFSLDTFDVDGAVAVKRIGNRPHSIYGPAFKKQQFSLDIRDIEGAQANTVVRGPKGTRGRA